MAKLETAFCIATAALLNVLWPCMAFEITVGAGRAARSVQVSGPVTPGLA